MHRRRHLDYIGLKLYGVDGKVSGELRIVGLFTSKAAATPSADVPLLRRKLQDVVARSGYEPRSHAGKAFADALADYPRDEGFQIDADQLLEFARTIAQLGDRPRVRVLARTDRFDNFVSVLVFIPRDRYSAQVRTRVGDYLAQAFDGWFSAYYPHYPDADLVRVHYIIGRRNGPTPVRDAAALEEAVTRLTWTFGEELADAVVDRNFVAGWQNAFPPGYQEANSAADAIADIALFVSLGASNAAAVKLRKHGGGNLLQLRVYHYKTPIPLSDRVPLLENFGFRVIDEDTHTVTPTDGAARYLHEMEIEAADGSAIDVTEAGSRIEAAILAVWRGEAESDRYNLLTLKARLAWFDVAMLRALGRYLRQLGLGYSQGYIAGVLAAQPEVVGSLVLLFHALHDPSFTANRDRAAYASRDAIGKQLDGIQSLDDDRIIRRLLNLVEAGMRTNFYQRDSAGNRQPALAIKFDPAKIDGMPEPRPYREIFVYAPRVEGVHLRFGPIARGGIRWSDRPEDFRTEVLGLVKAQQVKNAVIVPVGAKGGFVPKRTACRRSRETWCRPRASPATRCSSVRCSTSPTICAATSYAAAGRLRRDGDDPYLVVAADKGTATFSDTANGIALERGFWLGDAFASGGSVGYDHKKMGITARGAWEAVKRHFRELDRDIQTPGFHRRRASATCRATCSATACF